MVYDPQTRSLLQTDQQYPGISSDQKTVKSYPDGSVDVYSGPKAPEGKGGNWIQTIPGKGWFGSSGFTVPNSSGLTKRGARAK
ncbi:DUF1214 domain-containing protein [Caballeronia sp.]|uniref:DUF1214 domain-containing protein n=1 Tax=Caballeronia sp. TaxID=1931223 RepID=UPI00341EC68D